MLWMVAVIKGCAPRANGHGDWPPHTMKRFYAMPFPLPLPSPGGRGDAETLRVDPGCHQKALHHSVQAGI